MHRDADKSMAGLKALPPHFVACGLTAVLALAGCRLDPECFGKDDCTSGFVCSRGRCALPDASLTDDAAVDDGGDDGGLIDAGPLLDGGFTDIGPRDLGFPDSGRTDLGFPTIFPDAGFESGIMPAGAIDPTVGTSTPTAISTGFRDLQNISLLTSTGTILLSDVTGDVMFKLDPNAIFPLSTLRVPSNAANGAVITPTRELYVCEQFGRRIRVQREFEQLDYTLIDNFYEYQFNAPEGIVMLSNGTVYFTDPPFGLGDRPRDLPFNGLFRFQAVGTATITVEWMGVPGLNSPDGLAVSPTQDRIYMTEVNSRMILVFDIGPNGRLRNRRGLALTTGITPNGMTVDDSGNIYVGTSTGVEVFADTGYYWGRIPVPGTVTDLTYSGADRNRIYATTTSTVYAIDVPVPGGPFAP